MTYSHAARVDAICRYHERRLAERAGSLLGVDEKKRPSRAEAKDAAREERQEQQAALRARKDAASRIENAEAKTPRGETK